MMGLWELLDRRPSQLSGGQQQRVALARAVISERPVCLMDEPLSNLDAKLRAEMRVEIRALQKRLGLTMVYVTHDQVEAMTMADHIVVLDKGRVQQVATPRELYAAPANTFLRALHRHAADEPDPCPLRLQGIARCRKAACSGSGRKISSSAQTACRRVWRMSNISAPINSPHSRSGPKPHRPAFTPACRPGKHSAIPDCICAGIRKPNICSAPTASGSTSPKREPPQPQPCRGNVR